MIKHFCDVCENEINEEEFEALKDFNEQISVPTYIANLGNKKAKEHDYQGGEETLTDICNGCRQGLRDIILGYIDAGRDPINK